MNAQTQADYLKENVELMQKSPARFLQTDNIGLRREIDDDTWKEALKKWNNNLLQPKQILI